MKNKIKTGSVIAFIIIFILAAGLIFLGGYFTTFGVSVGVQGEPMQLYGMAMYPNLDGEGQPRSYSAMIYNANAAIENGSAVAYVSDNGNAECKLSTAYFYGIDEDGYILYDEYSEEYFDISKDSLRGRAVTQVPYIGALLSFGYSDAGMIFFAVFTVVVFLLWVIYFIGFIRKCTNKDAGKIEEVGCEEEWIAAEPVESAETDLEDDLDGDKVSGTEEKELSKDDSLNTESDDDVKSEGFSDKLIPEFKGRGDEVYAYITGSLVKITKLEHAVSTLKEKKGIDIETWPYAALPAGTELRFTRSVLPVVVAVIDKINDAS